ncbi:2'-5' RNA ligase family protein [Jiella sp. M17.18]|uniref:2'-5' RNA ligase family protein n=1 Tax=Jiella sp. M17.18 TaxID=3234247 RepID=UPI0034DF73FD
MTDPLILTLALDAGTFAHVDAMRRAHFPPERNVIPAHLTLFHKLPGDELGAVTACLSSAAASAGPIPLAIAGLRFLGRGSAYAVASPALQALRARLAAEFALWLTPQDRQRFAPHITIQNKVAPETARRTFETLSTAFEPFEAQGVGLLLWHYRSGPWEPAGAFPLTGA